MSYQCTCFYDNPGIADIKTYCETATSSWDAATHGDPCCVTGLTGDLIFAATPATGYAFKRWRYRTGSEDAPVRYSYDNPFIYRDAADIFIRAEASVPLLLVGSLDVTQYVAKDGIDVSQTERNTRLTVTMDGSLHRFAQRKLYMAVSFLPVCEHFVSLLKNELSGNTVTVTMDGAAYPCYHEMTDTVSTVVGATVYHRISIVFEEV